MLARPSTIVKQKAPNRTEHDIVVSSVIDCKPPYGGYGSLQSIVASYLMTSGLPPAMAEIACTSLVLRPNAAICGLGTRQQVRMRT